MSKNAKSNSLENGVTGNAALLSRDVIAACVLLAMMVFGVFGQTVRHSFINYDDDAYVYSNPLVTSGLTVAGIGQAFTRRELGLWAPLVTVSHMLDCQLYGLNAGGHHLTNVLLHAASAILLFLILRQMTGTLWRSWFVAAVFAIHPLRVESVAWIAERKDMLSGLFFMLTLAAYVRYVRRRGSRWSYCAALVLFALGLMCKPMVVTLPFVLLLLDYWPLNRLLIPGDPSKKSSVQWRVLREKIPFLALSCGSCLVTLLGPQAPVSSDIDQVPFWTRMAEAPVWYVTYLCQVVWPRGLALIYTHHEAALPWSVPALAMLALLSVAAFLLRKKHPYLWMGWLWNLGMLAPVSGLVQISRHARADHYTYLPQIGLYIGLTWAVADWAAHTPRLRPAVATMAALTLSALSLAAWHQTAFWRDSIALWTHALECTTDNRFAHNNLGTALNAQGRIDEAVAQYWAALRIDPADVAIHCNLGSALAREGRMEEAIAVYRDALRIDPASADIHDQVAVALFKLGRGEEAIAEFREALRLNPDFAEAHYNLGLTLFHQGQTEDAIAEYREALRLHPDYAEAHYNLGLALFHQGQTEDAIAQYREALRINPASAEMHGQLAFALARQGRTEEASAQYREVLRLDPDDAKAQFNFGNLLIRQGQAQEAIACYREALRIDPAYAEAHTNLGLALFNQGQNEEAIAQARKAVDLEPANGLLQNNLAWILATAPQASLRDGPRAVELAAQASQSAGGNNPGFLGTLAAAYAETGKFSDAVQTAQKALELAQAQSDADLAGQLRHAIELYQAGHRFEQAR